MSVHVHTHIYTHDHAHVHKHAHAHVCTNVYQKSMYMSQHNSKHMSIHMCTHISMYTSVHMSIHLYVHMCIHMFMTHCLYMSVYLYVHMSAQISVHIRAHGSVHIRAHGSGSRRLTAYGSGVGSYFLLVVWLHWVRMSDWLVALSENGWLTDCTEWEQSEVRMRWPVLSAPWASRDVWTAVRGLDCDYVELSHHPKSSHRHAVRKNGWLFRYGTEHVIREWWSSGVYARGSST